MIEFSNRTIWVKHKDGSSTLFDADALFHRILNALKSTTSEDIESIADAAVYAVEHALHYLNGNQDSAIRISAADLDTMIVKILHSAKMEDAAMNFMKTQDIDFSDVSKTVEEILFFLREKFSNFSEDTLYVAKKVSLVLHSIGAKFNGHETLVLELTKHFFEITSSRDKSITQIQMPSYQQDQAYKIPPESFIRELSETSTLFVKKDIVRAFTIDLRIFPSLRFDVRLFPLLTYSGFDCPVTELALASYYAPLADCLDEIAVRADELCRLMGNDAITPLKIVLCFPDAAQFAIDAMGCSNTKAADVAIRGIIDIILNNMTRVPDKVLCH